MGGGRNSPSSITVAVRVLGAVLKDQSSSSFMAERPKSNSKKKTDFSAMTSPFSIKPYKDMEKHFRDESSRQASVPRLTFCMNLC